MLNGLMIDRERNSTEMSIPLKKCQNTGGVNGDDISGKYVL
jgi:hypothetical protein